MKHNMDSYTQQLCALHKELNQAIDRALANGQNVYDPTIESLRLARTDVRHRLEDLGVQMVLKRRPGSYARTL